MWLTRFFHLKVLSYYVFPVKKHEKHEWKHEVTMFYHSLPLKNGSWSKVTAFFHFPGPYNLKNGDNSKSPKNELLGFAMQQEK